MEGESDIFERLADAQDGKKKSNCVYSIMRNVLYVHDEFQEGAQRSRRDGSVAGIVPIPCEAKVEEGGLGTQLSCMVKTVDFENEKAISETWKIVDRYREEGRSGKALERSEFKRLMADVQCGRINAIVVYKIDRITRSLCDFYTLWETVEQHDVQFVSL